MNFTPRASLSLKISAPLVMCLLWKSGAGRVFIACFVILMPMPIFIEWLSSLRYLCDPSPWICYRSFALAWDYSNHWARAPSAASDCPKSLLECLERSNELWLATGWVRESQPHCAPQIVHMWANHFESTVRAHWRGLWPMEAASWWATGPTELVPNHRPRIAQVGPETSWFGCRGGRMEWCRDPVSAVQSFRNVLPKAWDCKKTLKPGLLSNVLLKCVARRRDAVAAGAGAYVSKLAEFTGKSKPLEGVVGLLLHPSLGAWNIFYFDQLWRPKWFLAIVFFWNCRREVSRRFV